MLVLKISWNFYVSKRVRTFGSDGDGHDEDIDDCTFHAVYYACRNIMPSLAVSCQEAFRFRLSIHVCVSVIMY